MVETDRRQVAGTWLLDHELWLVGTLVLFSIAFSDSTAASQRLAVVLFWGLFFWPLRRVITGRWTVRTPVDWPM